jgi:EAL domain-containing protein (putative c-di-GMP-specific phosphodiesterase class I)
MVDPAFVADVGRILAMSGLEPSSLTLEITESVLIKDVEATVSAFGALKALGIMLAIDDFGTGYSSLSYLRQFPIDILKVDRSFVASLDGSTDSVALVRSILNLGSTLRLDTVAEGIETSEQREVLRGLGARRGQGYLFARPMSPDDLRDLLIRGARPGPPNGPAASRKPGLRADRRRPEGKAIRLPGPQRATQPRPPVADEVH